MAAKYTDVITTNSGTALPGATVQLLDGSGSLVTTYTDAALTQNAATSRTADDDGLVELYVADGTYTVRQAYGSVTRDLANVELYDISTIASTSSGAVANKAQASAIGISGAAENMGSYTGSTIPDNETAKQNIQSLETAVETKANATAVGVASSAANMGTYTGTTIPDNETAKQNIQSLETAVETKANASAVGVTSSASNMGTYTGSTITDNQTAKQNIQELETAVETKAPNAFSRSASYSAGTVGKLLQDSTRSFVFDFGGVGDDSTDNTTAFTSAIAYIESTGNNVFVPPGTYRMDPAVLDPATYGTQGHFFGLDRERTIFKRRTTGAGPFITVGASTGTIFQSGLVFEGIQIDGGATTNGPALRCYDLVRSKFRDCLFTGGSYAAQLYGGIALSFDQCIFQSATRGLQVEKFTSSAGGGWPNLIRVSNSQIVDNTEWGVWFDYGRVLILDGCDIEGNGTTLAAAQGGLYVGPNISQEVTVTDTQSQGVMVQNCWFEANLGVADIHLNSGVNSIRDSQFFSTSSQTTNDIKIDGGRYTIDNVNGSFSKAANVLENSGAATGNIIRMADMANLSYSSAKTSVESGSSTILRNGSVPGINGATAPLIQTGTDSSGVNPTITFSQAFKTATTPRIWCQIVNNDTGTIQNVEVYSISNTGFTMRKKSFDGATIGTSNYTVYWEAIGENP